MQSFSSPLPGFVLNIQWLASRKPKRIRIRRGVAPTRRLSKRPGFLAPRNLARVYRPSSSLFARRRRLTSFDFVGRGEERRERGVERRIDRSIVQGGNETSFPLNVWSNFAFDRATDKFVVKDIRAIVS